MSSRSVFPFLLLLIACGPPDHPARDHLEREGPPRRSDKLVRVMVGMVERIEDLPLTGDRDVNIARELIEHHRGTIELNSVFIAESDNERLKDFARELTQEREREIAQWQDFLDDHPPVPEAGLRGPPDAMRDLQLLEPTDDLDAAYVELMRIHLQDGINKVRLQVERGQHDEIKHWTRAMIERATARLEELEAIGGV
jgi:uncharacterized protein (DUF305 family)